MRRNTLYIYLSCLVILCMLNSLSCKTDEIILPQPYQPPNDLRKIIPLAVGHTWTYSSWQTYACGDSFPAECLREIVLKRSVVDSVTYQGKECFIIKTQIMDPDQVYGLELECVDSATYIRYAIYHSENTLYRRTILQLPLEVDNMWQYAENDSMAILSVNSNVEIDNTNYNHAIFLAIHGYIHFQTVIIPGIGVIFDDNYISPFGTIGLKFIEKNF